MPSVEERLARMSNLHPDQAKRDEAAQAYRELTGKDPPVFEGPVGEGEARMGAPSARANMPKADPAAVPEQSFMDKAVGGVGDFVTGPLNAGAAKLNDVVSMGVYPKFLDMIGASSPEYRRKLEEDHPVASTIGTGAGIAATAMLPMGPAAVMDRAVAQGAETLAPQLARTVGGQIARGTASGGLVGGTAALTTGNGSVEDMLRKFEQGAEGGAVMGGGLTALGVGMQAGSRGIQAAAPRIRDYVNAKESGAYDSPELQGLAKGAGGVKQVAENAGEAVIARGNQMSARDKANYDADMGPHLQSTNIDKDRSQSRLFAEALSNLHADTGAPKDPAVAAALKEAFDQVSNTKTVKGMLDNLESARSKAGFESVSPTPENMGQRRAYSAMNDGLDASLPQGARDARSEARRSLEGERRRNDILANTEGDISRGQNSAGDENLRVTKEKLVSRLLARVGDENVPGLEAKRYLDELAAQDPEIARQIQLVQAKKAQEAVRPSLTPLVPLNLAETNEGAGYGPMFRQLGRSAGAHVIEPALRQGGRAAVESGARMGGVPPLLAAPVDAVIHRRKRK